MSDDIVTRLRELREVLMGNPIMAREVQEAIDEIERLRAERDEAEKWAKIYAEMYAHLESRILQITEIVKYFDTKYEVVRDE